MRVARVVYLERKGAGRNCYTWFKALPPSSRENHPGRLPWKEGPAAAAGSLEGFSAALVNSLV